MHVGFTNNEPLPKISSHTNFWMLLINWIYSFTSSSHFQFTRSHIECLRCKYAHRIWAWAQFMWLFCSRQNLTAVRCPGKPFNVECTSPMQCVSQPQICFNYNALMNKNGTLTHCGMLQIIPHVLLILCLSLSLSHSLTMSVLCPYRRIRCTSYIHIHFD